MCPALKPLDKKGPIQGRPSYHPATLLKIYIYGYLNRVSSSRRLERECQRNIELVWLTGQLAPDFKTIADFRKDNGKAIREVCRSFAALCRELDLLSVASVAIDGSKFKAVNARDKNFSSASFRSLVRMLRRPGGRPPTFLWPFLKALTGGFSFGIGYHLKVVIDDYTIIGCHWMILL